MNEKSTDGRDVSKITPQYDPGALETEDDERSYELQSVPPDSDQLHQKAAPVSGDDVTNEMLLTDGEQADRWLTHNKGLGQSGFSPADRLTPDNASDLSEAWVYKTDSEGLETTPVVVPDDPPTMYFTEENMTVHAVNARTGDEYWTFQPKTPEEPGGILHNRGVAVWGDKVYFGTVTSDVIALDRYTGEKQWQTSTITERQRNTERDGLPEAKRVSITQAPVAYDGRIYVGQSSDVAGMAVVSAIDAESGDMSWQSTNAPEDQYVGDAWKFVSNGTWMNPAIDPKSDTVFVQTGNPNPMFYGVVRPGPNKQSNSVVAFDAQSGDLRWENQLIPHEMWDADMGAAPMVLNMEMDDETRRVVSMDWKGGWNYILDANSGDLIQRSEAFAKEGGPNRFTYVPAGEQNKEAFFPIPCPEWAGQSYSPKTGLRYITVADGGRYHYADPTWTPESTSGAGGGFISIPAEDVRDKFGREGYGALEAFDPVTGEMQWQYKLPDVDPAEIGGRYSPGGSTATAGGVVIVGSSGGGIFTVDAENGNQLSRYDTGSDFPGQRIQATPMTWTDQGNDKQYISVSSHDGIYTLSV